ncbi:MAG: hypothetical protein HY370_02015 [Proteobacteria bacterium]|nr:hypothetical protein [Pseudomonadota bacterium]
MAFDADKMRSHFDDACGIFTWPGKGLRALDQAFGREKGLVDAESGLAFTQILAPDTMKDEKGKDIDTSKKMQNYGRELHKYDPKIVSETLKDPKFHEIEKNVREIYAHFPAFEDTMREEYPDFHKKINELSASKSPMTDMAKMGLMVNSMACDEKLRNSIIGMITPYAEMNEKSDLWQEFQNELDKRSTQPAPAPSVAPPRPAAAASVPAM